MSPRSFLREPTRQTPIAGRFDVVVCGAGPAGVSAAIAAARAGAKTALLEGNGALGGIWTAGLLSYVLDADRTDGLLPEIISELKLRDAYRPRIAKDFTFDPEQMKVVLEHLCMEAGIYIQLYTRVAAAQVDHEGHLTAVITESKSGREAWEAKIFIDCTGDGDLAAYAGCRYDIGRSENAETQPMSLLALVTGVDVALAKPFYDGNVAGRRQHLLEEMVQAGHTPSYSSPGLFHIRDDLFALMAHHHYLGRADCTRDLTEATLTGRQEVNSAVRALRASGRPVWKNIRLITTAAHIGIREGRRIHGLSTIVAADLAEGRSHRPSACRATFGMDVHSTNPAAAKDFDFSGRKPVKPYDIPYGALIARDVKGLMMAGRCISGDFFAHASYRVTGNSVDLGSSAGKAAAECVALGIAPHELVCAASH